MAFHPSDSQIIRKVYNEDKEAIKVTGEDLVINVDYDRIDVTYPDDVSEVFTYKLSGDTVMAVTVTYTDNTKENLLSVVTA